MANTYTHSARQYKYRFPGLKNIKEDEWVLIREEIHNRGRLGKESVVFLHDRVLPEARVKRGVARARVAKPVSARKYHRCRGGPRTQWLTSTKRASSSINSMGGLQFERPHQSTPEANKTDPSSLGDLGLLGFFQLPIHLKLHLKRHVKLHAKLYLALPCKDLNLVPAPATSAVFRSDWRNLSANRHGPHSKKSSMAVHNRRLYVERRRYGTHNLASTIACLR
jgi:hypothetical protein